LPIVAPEGVEPGEVHQDQERAKGQPVVPESHDLAQADVERGQHHAIDRPRRHADAEGGNLAAATGTSIHHRPHAASTGAGRA
jgi:hypothetical protein